MQPNKNKIALVLGSLFLGVSGNTIAASETFTVTVQTIPDVVLTEITKLSYGSTMFVTQGQSCLMNASTPGDLIADQMQYDDVGAVAKAFYGDLTGTGCVNGTGTGTPGVYRIKGIASNTVNITISGINGTDFDFSPNSGCIVTYDNTAGADSCDAFVPGISTPKLLAHATTEDVGTAASDPSVPGEIIFTVGGTVTIGGTAAVDLTPNQAYTATFPVNVIY
ncbi:MAG: hypothetical protein GY951_18530 [Psychromonas sp.]|nr:hypothetical protein [Alteromonadales bacterium]MCP5080028.1 hypothetical protein [Psychromonas sp.]